MSLVHIVSKLRSLGHVWDEVITPVSHSVRWWVVGRVYVAHRVSCDVARAPLDESQLVSRAVSRDDVSISTIIILHVSKVNLVKVIPKGSVDGYVEELIVLALVEACFSHKGLLIEVTVPSGIDEELKLI